MNEEKSIDMTDTTEDLDPMRDYAIPASDPAPAWRASAEPFAEPEPDATALPAPRIRWAAVVWGLALASIAATALWIVSASERRDAFMEWMLSLSVPAAVAYGVLALGALVLVAGIVGMVRRLQRAREERGAA